MSLPDIYNAAAPRIGQPYPYKSAVDQQNNVMINKLLNRKKSYERMMRNGDSEDNRAKVRGGYIQDSRSSSVLEPMPNRVRLAASQKKQSLQYGESQGAPRKVGLSRSNRPEEMGDGQRYHSSVLDVNGQSISAQKNHQVRARQYASQPEL